MTEAQTRLPWTAEEDAILIDLVQKYGEKRWNMVANGLPGRTGKGCSHRWRTYLRPDVKHPHLEPFTEWEAAVIVQAQREMGNNWLAIAKLLLPGRSNTAVKNFWHCRLKSGSGTHTNRFIVENYNLRYLLNEVPEKDKLHPVALPAFPSTAPTGHVRRQIHPRPRQEAAAAAAAMAEAQQLAAQMAAQAMALDPSQAYMQQGMMDPSEGYVGMYSGYDSTQMAMAQTGYGSMPLPSFSSKEEMKQHASTYVQQQLALMGHKSTARTGGGSSSTSRRNAAASGMSMQDMAYSSAAWQGSYGQDTVAAAATAAVSGPSGPKKTGRGRGRPPGSKNHANNNAAAAAAAASAAAAEQQQQQQLYHQQHYSMNARASQDEAATWCSSGMLLAGSAAAAAGANAGGSPGDVNSNLTFLVPQSLPPSSLPMAADPMDPAALAAAPVPLQAGTMDAVAVGLTAANSHAAAATASASGVAAGVAECSGLLPTSAAAAAELNRLPLANQFRVSMTGLDFELETAAGANCMRFSARSLKLFECDEGATIPGYKASISSMDFRTSLTSFDDILGGHAANRMSDHTHIALRGPSWDGGSPNSRPTEAATAGGAPSVGTAAVAGTAVTSAPDGSTAEDTLATAFRQQQQQVMLPPVSAGINSGTWVAAQQPPNSAAAAATPSVSLVSGPPGGQLGPFSLPAEATVQEDIHPGALAAIAADPGLAGADAGQGQGETPFGASRLQEVPFSPAPDAAMAAALPSELPGPFSQATAQVAMTQCADAAAAASGADKTAQRAPPSAPQMPPAFQSVLQALQPPSGSSTAAPAAVPSATPGGIKADHHQQQLQQQQQHSGGEPALAAASPAITGLNATGNALASGSMAPPSFSVSMAAAGTQQQQQQLLMPMPMPLPPQLLLPAVRQPGTAPRVSDLPLPSPIDLFNGDHGLHPDDLLIDADTVFDERLLLASHDIKQQQRLRQAAHNGMQLPGGVTQQYVQPIHHAAELDTAEGSAAAAATVKLEDSHTAVPARAALNGSSNAASGMLSGGQAGAAAAGKQEQPDTSDRPSLKRQRSSSNGSGWVKKQRPSEGSLLEVYSGNHGHSLDDCLQFWHD